MIKGDIQQGTFAPTRKLNTLAVKIIYIVSLGVPIPARPGPLTPPAPLRPVKAGGRDSIRAP